MSKDKKIENTGEVEVFDIIPDDVLSRLEVIDLEDEEYEEESEEGEAVEVFDIIPDNVLSRLENVD